MTKRALQGLTLQEEHDQFYAALGRAISQWEFVESALCNFFVCLIHAAEGGAANAAFYSIVNFRSKLDMTNAAANMRVLDHEIHKQWDTLFNRIKKLSTRRNELAHFSVVQGNTNPDCHYIHLQPSFFNLNNLKGYANKKATEHNVHSLVQLAGMFASMANDIEEFRLRHFVKTP